jgi:lipoprotein NlpD
MHFRKLIVIFIAFEFLWGCSGPVYKAPVVDAKPIPSHRIKTHVVGPGETLYSIALRYDIDHKKLIEINELNKNKTIFYGQVLKLEGNIVKPADRPLAKPVTTPAKSPPVVQSRNKNQTIAKPASSSAKVPVAGLNWSWPVKGEVLDKFQSGEGLNKGIDIGGKLGEPVLAAAVGEVVYSGTGLRGYGNLVIVKHNEQLLSAYAHNRVLVVAEGDKVKAGQKIAEVGSSGTDSVKLHFEIRLDGKPVDPLDYLPKP